MAKLPGKIEVEVKNLPQFETLNDNFNKAIGVLKFYADPKNYVDGRPYKHIHISAKGTATERSVGLRCAEWQHWTEAEDVLTELGEL